MFDQSRLNRRRMLQLSALTGAGMLGANRIGAARAQDAPSGKISYWHHFTSETEMAGMARVIEGFKTSAPGVEVVAENIPNADYMAKFTSAALANSLPDTAMVTVDRLPDIYGMDAVLPLNQWYDTWDLKDAFAPSVWEGATIDGQLYGIPSFMFVNWMYYRKDWFEEAGIAGPPTTWQEFVDAAIKLTDPAKGRYGFGLRGGDGGEGALLQLMQAFGASFVDDSGCANFGTDAAAEALASYTELFTVHKAAPPSAPNDSFRQVMEAFETGQTGMILHHTGSLTEVTAALGENVMTAKWPSGPAGFISWTQPQYNSLTKEDNAEAGWAWLSEWGKADVEVGFLEETGYFPPNQQVATNPTITGNPLYNAAVETLSEGTLPPRFAGYPGWSKQTVLPEFQQVLIGEKSAADAAQAMAEGLKTATGC
ncbi:sugar ABC transporter substrate-binding protein [soil metagenome]